jgi:hypothetical protein
MTKYRHDDPEMLYTPMPFSMGNPAWYEELGLFAKHKALDAHEANTSDLLVPCRAYLKTLYRSSLRPVHADDARAWLDLAGIPESQRGEVKAWMGALFRGEEWEAVGWTTSAHPENHGRVIRTWRLR